MRTSIKQSAALLLCAALIAADFGSGGRQALAGQISRPGETRGRAFSGRRFIGTGLPREQVSVAAPLLPDGLAAENPAKDIGAIVPQAGPVDAEQAAPAQAQVPPNEAQIQKDRPLEQVEQAPRQVAAVTRGAQAALAQKGSAHPTADFRTTFDGGKVAFVNNDNGPVWNFHVQPGRPAWEPGKPAGERDYGGRTPVFVDFGVNKSLPHWLKMKLPALKEITRNEIPGLQYWVVDREQNRLPEADHFIAGDITGFEKDRGKALVETVLEEAEKKNAVIVAGYASVQSNIRWASALQEAVQTTGHNPDIMVNPLAAVEATIRKAGVREIVNRLLPGLKVPFRSISLDMDQAIQAFREVQAEIREIQGAPGQVIMKFQGSGKSGIAGRRRTEEQVRDAVVNMQERFKYWDAHPEEAARHSIPSPENRKILMEWQPFKRDLLMELDQELMVGRSKRPEWPLEAIATSIANADPVPGPQVERGMIYPALLPSWMSRALAVTALESVLAVWSTASPENAPMRMPFGGFHTEWLFWRHPATKLIRPFFIEINARSIGGKGVPLFKEATEGPKGNLRGTDLARAGVRAALGLDLDSTPEKQPEDFLVELKMLFEKGGTVAETVAIPETLARLENMILPPVMRDYTAGTVVTSPYDYKEGMDGVGYVKTRDRNPRAALQSAIAGMNEFIVTVKTPRGEIHTQRGGWGHSLSQHHDARRLKQPPAGQWGGPQP